MFNAYRTNMQERFGNLTMLFVARQVATASTTLVPAYLVFFELAKKWLPFYTTGR